MPRENPDHKRLRRFLPFFSPQNRPLPVLRVRTPKMARPHPPKLYSQYKTDPSDPLSGGLCLRMMHELQSSQQEENQMFFLRMRGSTTWLMGSWLCVARTLSDITPLGVIWVPQLRVGPWSLGCELFFSSSFDGPTQEPAGLHDNCPPRPLVATCFSLLVFISFPSFGRVSPQNQPPNKSALFFPMATKAVSLIEHSADAPQTCFLLGDWSGASF